MTDGELVRQALCHDRTSCDDLVRRWTARVLAVCHARIGNRHLAEDLAQESLLRAIRGLSTLENPDKFGPWVCGIATRVCLDWRKAKQTSQVNFTGLSPEHWPDDMAVTHSDSVTAEVDGADDLECLLKEVELLPEKYREVLMLFYYQELTYQEMAELLGTSSATINARLSQARAMLRQRLNCQRGHHD